MNLFFDYKYLLIAIVLSSSLSLFLYCVKTEQNEKRRKLNEKVSLLDRMIENFLSQITTVLSTLAVLTIFFLLIEKMLR